MRTWNKTKDNPGWTGGNWHRYNQEKLARLTIKILSLHPNCELCGKPAVRVGLRDGKSWNCTKKNLAPLCKGCEIKRVYKKYTCKYRKLFGESLQEIADKCGMTVTGIREKLKRNNLKGGKRGTSTVSVKDRICKSQRTRDHRPAGKKKLVS